jgi:hypothetical protein
MNVSVGASGNPDSDASSPAVASSPPLSAPLLVPPELPLDAPLELPLELPPEPPLELPLVLPPELPLDPVEPTSFRVLESSPPPSSPRNS